MRYVVTHRKQVLLFLIAVVLPSAALVYFTSRMLDQERELIEKRERDQRILLVREFGQMVLRRLESIKQEELRLYQTGVALDSVQEYANPEVKLIALVEQGELRLPWEIDTSADRSLVLLNDPIFSRRVRLGERAEFIENRPRKAAREYRQALSSAREPVQQGHATLLLARVLRRMGLNEDSLASYRQVLDLPFSVVDESGIPMALYAADNLLQESGVVEGVMQRLQARLSSRDWLAPAEAFLIEDLLQAVMGCSLDHTTSQSAANCTRTAEEHIEKLERSLTLKWEFPDLLLLYDGLGRATPEDPLWIPFGQDPWLISVAQSEQSSLPFLVAVGASQVIDSVNTDRASSAALGDGVPRVSIASTGGQALGPNFPGLTAAIEVDTNKDPSTSWGLQFFYLLALLLVLSVTFFGAYLLWRDVRREVRAAELRSQFVSSVSHELRTPLTAIRMFAETLRLGRTKSPSTRREYLETIINEAERLTRLLNNVLDFSRIESGRRSYRAEASDLSDIVCDAVKAMEYPLKQGGFELEVDNDRSMPKVTVDRDGLEQAILNLLDNAMKYSGNSRHIDLKLRREDTQAIIQVKDRGLGIDPKDQKRIFEKFYRAPSATSARIPGTGLGLSLVSHVVNAHGGHLEVESGLGQGSTFSIYLPLGAK